MTPKEKAEELIFKHWNAKVDTFHIKESIMSKELAKQCALIAQQNLLQKLKELNIEYSFEEQVLFEINVL